MDAEEIRRIARDEIQTADARRRQEFDEWRSDLLNELDLKHEQLRSELYPKTGQPDATDGVT